MIIKRFIIMPDLQYIWIVAAFIIAMFIMPGILDNIQKSIGKEGGTSD